MTHYVRGTVETMRHGSDDHVRWLTLCLPSGLLLAGIFDHQRLTAPLTPGTACELVLELTYPPPRAVAAPHQPTAWQAGILDLTWPCPVGGIARAPLPRAKDRHHGEPTGPTCVLLQTPFGHMQTTKSHLPYFGVAARNGATIAVPPGQRLLVLAVL